MEDNNDQNLTLGDSNTTLSQFAKLLRSLDPPAPSQNIEKNPESKPGHPRILIKAASTPVVLNLSSRGFQEQQEQSIILDSNAQLNSGNRVSKFAVVQSHNDIGYDINITFQEPESSSQQSAVFRCRFYFDPAQDSVVIVSYSLQTIVLRKRNDNPHSSYSSQSPEESRLECKDCKALDPGCWSAFTNSNLHILDFSILRRERLIVGKDVDDGEGNEAKALTQPPRKRHLELSQTINERSKARQIENTDGAVIVFQAAPPATPTNDVDPTLTHPIPMVYHPLEQLKKGEVAKVIDSSGEDYTLSRGENIMVNSNSMVFGATHSRFPREMIVVKVLRVHKPSDGASDLINTAEMWLTEVKNHSGLKRHPCIVRFYEADARFLSLYIEHIDAPSLAHYRTPESDNPFCTLTIGDAERVLRDISTALLCIHSQGIIHNDIKPANILYSADRGAILIDFGLSTKNSGDSYAAGGTPWYLPPEYSSNMFRGASGDVWALGVVELFLLGQIPLPEMRNPPIVWQMGDIDESGADGVLARENMDKWIAVVTQTRDKLDTENSRVESLVWQMLRQKVEYRIGVPELALEITDYDDNAGTSEEEDDNDEEISEEA